MNTIIEAPGGRMEKRESGERKIGGNGNQTSPCLRRQAIVEVTMGKIELIRNKMQKINRPLNLFAIDLLLLSIDIRQQVTRKYFKINILKNEISQLSIQDSQKGRFLGFIKPVYSKGQFLLSQKGPEAIFLPFINRKTMVRGFLDLTAEIAKASLRTQRKTWRSLRDLSVLCGLVFVPTSRHQSDSSYRRNENPRGFLELRGFAMAREITFFYFFPS